MCQTEGTPLGDASNKGLGPKMQNHQLSWWIFILLEEMKFLKKIAVISAILEKPQKCQEKFNNIVSSFR